MLFGFCSDLDFTIEVPFKLVKFKRGFSILGNNSALRRLWVT